MTSMSVGVGGVKETLSEDSLRQPKTLRPEQAGREAVSPVPEVNSRGGATVREDTTGVDIGTADQRESDPV